jgi:hypothetical protein
MQKPYVFKNVDCSQYLGDAPLVGNLEVTIDWEKLAKHLGRKAAHNKSGKTGLQFGIKAKFIPNKAS